MSSLHAWFGGVPCLLFVWYCDWIELLWLVWLLSHHRPLGRIVHAVVFVDTAEYSLLGLSFHTHTICAWLLLTIFANSLSCFPQQNLCTD